ASGVEALEPVMADRHLMAFAMKGIDDMGARFLVVFDQQNLHGAANQIWKSHCPGNGQRMQADEPGSRADARFCRGAGPRTHAAVRKAGDRPLPPPSPCASIAATLAGDRSSTGNRDPTESARRADSIVTSVCASTCRSDRHDQ